MNWQSYIGVGVAFAAIVICGVLVTGGWLGGSYADTAIGMLTGGLATGGAIHTAKQLTDTPAGNNGGGA